MIPVLFSPHQFRPRDGGRPIHMASCPCWRGELRPTSFGPRPRASLWDYLAWPSRTRGTRP